MIPEQHSHLHILQLNNLSWQIPVLTHSLHFPVLFAATQNNILVLIQNHTKPGGVSFECKGLWLILVACCAPNTCVFLVGLMLFLACRVNCMFAVHHY